MGRKNVARWETVDKSNTVMFIAGCAIDERVGCKNRKNRRRIKVGGYLTNALLDDSLFTKGHGQLRDTFLTAKKKVSSLCGYCIYEGRCCEPVRPDQAVKIVGGDDRGQDGTTGVKREDG